MNLGNCAGRARVLPKWQESRCELFVLGDNVAVSVSNTLRCCGLVFGCRTHGGFGCSHFLGPAGIFQFGFCQSNACLGGSVQFLGYSGIRCG